MSKDWESKRTIEGVFEIEKAKEREREREREIENIRTIKKKRKKYIKRKLIYFIEEKRMENEHMETSVREK